MSKEDLIKEYQELKKMLYEVEEVYRQLSSMLFTAEKFSKWYKEYFSEKFVSEFMTLNNEIIDRQLNEEKFCHHKLSIYKNPDSLQVRISKKLKQLAEEENE